ncbi:hypothetical protein QYE76_046967 [Lolium multiflorum]|uniref:Uncharacterized protein n=1 Tax=Lolium multiflorum TaxID=4521 RepID=A0AAD8WZP4_LOLMU|nr:hypothetical protein QYE76_046967 [Lolium multiflorum]
MDVLDFTDLELELACQDKSFADELVEIEERMAGAAVDLPTFKPGENGKMMELVSQTCIRALMKSPPPSKPLPDYSFEALRRLGITDQEELEAVARSFRDLQSAVDIQNDIIQQYRAQGYAYFLLPKNSERYPPPASVN